MEKANFPIAYYRMPGEKEVWFLQSTSSAKEIDSLQNIPGKPGFILYPFSPDSSCKPIFIHADKLSSISIEELSSTIENEENIFSSIVESQSGSGSKTKEKYCQMIEGALNEIHSGKLQKVVLSRMKTIHNTSHQNPLQLFYKLCNKYPTAFVSLVYNPGKELWITATPELLVSVNQNEIKTVALAGTKHKDSIKDWGEKEKMEQQLVTDYINGILQKYCRNITISGPQEVVAGNIQHLKTSFSATLNSDVWNLVSALHPTPAVCGIPLNEARDFIKEVEGYDRKYYAGFLGPYNVNEKTNLFVNLRCAEVFANSVNLYVGGGITKKSVPESEWNETELKAKTILSVLEETLNEAR